MNIVYPSKEIEENKNSNDFVTIEVLNPKMKRMETQDVSKERFDMLKPHTNQLLLNRNSLKELSLENESEIKHLMIRGSDVELNSTVNLLIRKGILDTNSATTVVIYLLPFKTKRVADSGKHKFHKYLSYLDSIYAYLVFLPLRVESEGESNHCMPKQNFISSQYAEMAQAPVSFPIYYLRFDGQSERDIYFIIEWEIELPFEHLIEKMIIYTDFASTEEYNNTSFLLSSIPSKHEFSSPLAHELNLSKYGILSTDPYQPLRLTASFTEEITLKLKIDGASKFSEERAKSIEIGLLVGIPLNIMLYINRENRD